MKKLTYSIFKSLVFVSISVIVFMYVYDAKIKPHTPKYMETVHQKTNDAIRKQTIQTIMDEIDFVYNEVQGVTEIDELISIFASYKQGNNYFWALRRSNDIGSDFNFIYHPLQNYIDSLGIQNFKDKNGASFFQDVLSQAASNGDGTVIYLSENSVKTQTNKVVYAKYFEADNFIIGKSRVLPYLLANPVEEGQIKYLFAILSVSIVLSVLAGFLVLSIFKIIISFIFSKKSPIATVTNKDSENDLIESDKELAEEDSNTDIVESAAEEDAIKEELVAVDDHKPFEPKIVGFLCNWCSYAGADKAGSAQNPYPTNVRIVKVMCSGRVDPEFILKAFKEGADGVMILACHPGDCHYKEGNYRAAQRYQMLIKLLDQYGIEEDRCYFDYVSAGEGEKFVKVITETVDKVKGLGPLKI